MIISFGSTSEASAVIEDRFPFLRLSAGGDSPATARIQPGCFCFFPPLPLLGREAREAPQPLDAEGKEEEEEEEEAAEAAAAVRVPGLKLDFASFSTLAHAQADAVTSPLSPSAAAAMAPSVAAAAAAEEPLPPFLIPPP